MVNNQPITNVEELLEANKFVFEDEFTCEELNESLLKLKNNKISRI